MSKLIPLESLKAFLKSRRFTEEKNGGYVLSLSPTVIDELDSLATIDPLATIDEMIDVAESQNGILTSFIIGIQVGTLKKLKSRLYPNP